MLQRNFNHIVANSTVYLIMKTRLYWTPGNLSIQKQQLPQADPYFEEFKHSFPDKKDIPRILKTLNEGNYLIKQEITRNLMMYEKTETLKAEYMADISPQKAYGFKNK